MSDDKNVTNEPEETPSGTAWLRAVESSPLEASSVERLFVGQPDDEDSRPQGEPAWDLAPEPVSEPQSEPAISHEPEPGPEIAEPEPAEPEPELPDPVAQDPLQTVPDQPAEPVQTAVVPSASTEQALWATPSDDPVAPGTIETASATTDRDAAKASGPAPLLIAFGVVLALAALSAGIGSCASAVVRLAAQDYVGDYDYYDDYYDDYDDYDYDDPYDEWMREIFGDEYDELFDDEGEDEAPRGRRRHDSSRGGSNSRPTSYTTADILSDNELSLFDGGTVSVKASSYAGVQAPVADFVRALVSLDQKAAGDLTVHLRAASAATDDDARAAELKDAAEVARTAVKDLDSVVAPDSTEVEATENASVSRIVRDASTSAGALTDRWESVLATIEAVIEPLDDYADLQELDDSAAEALDAASSDIEDLLWEAAR